MIFCASQMFIWNVVQRIRCRRLENHKLAYFYYVASPLCSVTQKWIQTVEYTHIYFYVSQLHVSATSSKYKVLPRTGYEGPEREQMYSSTLPSTSALDGGWGTRWCSWLRHCATNRKVAGSIPHGITGIFHWHNPSGRTVALGVDSASNRNEYREYFLRGKGGRCVGLTTLPPSCADCLEIWEPQPAGILRACPGL